MLLAGLILKLGGFGILRFVLLLFPVESCTFKYYVIALCCIGYTFATFAAIRQLDVKRFIAFTSIAHMNFSLGALFTMQKMGFMAFFHTMISHGFIATGLFFMVGFLYNQIGSRDSLHVRGLATTSPIFSTYWFIFSMANAGMPMLSGFPGEFFGLASLSSVNFFMVFWFGIGFYFTAVYIFMNVTFILFGTPDILFARFRDLDRSSQANLLYLVIFVVAFGICPDIIFSTVSNSYSGSTRAGFQNNRVILGTVLATELVHIFHEVFSPNNVPSHEVEVRTVRIADSVFPKYMKLKSAKKLAGYIVPLKYYEDMCGHKSPHPARIYLSLP